MPLVQQALRVPLYQQCQAHLRARIESGEFAVNEALPTEEHLCRTYRVSRITVRRALSELTRQGLIATRQGSGTFVSPSRKYDKSLSLVGTFDDLGSPSPGVTQELLSRRLVSLSPEIADHFEVPVTQVECFEALYLRDHPFAHAAIFAPRDVGNLLSDVDLATSDGSIFSLIDARSAQRVAHVDQKIEAATASSALAKALNIERSVPVIRALRGYFSRDAVLLQSAIIHYHPQRFSIDVRFIP